jgi:putative protein kinase ArgK-like GTPase of G3E family
MLESKTVERSPEGEEEAVVVERPTEEGEEEAVEAVERHSQQEEKAEEAVERHSQQEEEAEEAVERHSQQEEKAEARGHPLKDRTLQHRLTGSRTSHSGWYPPPAAEERSPHRRE